jgi:TetR/AcrR family transcriptional repressor of nem operon
MARPSGRPIRDELIGAACTMVQQVGVNSFSYGALAKQLDISSPSIHHHFPSKDDLVGAVAARYRENFAERVTAIEASSAAERIRAYAALFADVTSQELVCFCGSIASDWHTVGEAAHTEVGGFFDDQLAWLTAQLTAGVAAGELVLRSEASDVAATIVAALEGAMLMARARNDPALPGTVGDVMVGLIGIPA